MSLSHLFAQSQKRLVCETSTGRLHRQKRRLSLGRPNQAQQAGLWRAITSQGFGMVQGKWVDSVQDATVLGGRAGCRAWAPLLKSRPHHVPLSLTGAKDPLLWSGTESDPHVSKPSFRVESEKVGLRDLNRPSSPSKATFVTGQAKSGPKKDDPWRAIRSQGFGMEKM
jgi:hypothetical protein